MATVLTSTSSSSASNNHPSGFSYDVFISFRGEDTRKAFTDHLYTALKQSGIRTFRDDDAMERGRLLKPELEKAIHESAISIIVFSKGYATSKWCLDEVFMIIEEYERSSSKHEVVPVFYNIDPTDVRNQTGFFEEAFIGYNELIRTETNVQKKIELSEKVRAWRGSLNKAGAFTGMVLGDGYEAKFIIGIVNVVKKKLDYKAIFIDDKLVGITDNVVKIESWLKDTSSNAVILLIHGIGGIGKTTIAKCTYNSNFREYDGSCFLANISETSNQPRGLLHLQSQLLSTILKSEKEETIWNENEGSVKIADAVCNKKVILVLDDVTTVQQLDALLGPQRFYPGSKVIITTRHTWLSTAFKVPSRVQTVTTLSTDQSIKLFSLYAFHQNQPVEPYVIRSKQVNRYCMGLPLALKVLGSYLRGKSVDEWEDAMCKLEAIPHPGIQKVLQLSYESLEDDNDKDLFLHIACFFVWKDKDYIVKLLSQCNLYPIVGIKNLMDRCLVSMVNGKVGMHQLIRKMGLEIVRKESPKDLGKRSRLWHHEDCFNVLKENVGTKKVEGLMLDMQQIKEGKSSSAIKIDNPRKRNFEKYQDNSLTGNESNFKFGALEKMKNLMLLQLNYATFSGKYKKLPTKLRLLIRHGFWLKSIPGDIGLEKLVVLDMSYSKLKRVWDDFKFIESLKILNLSYCVELIKTPHFDGLPGLESLILKGCISLTEVNESIAYLEGLVLLDLTDCRSLRNIPCLPTSLVSLQMSGCPNLGFVGGFKCLDSMSLPSLLMELNISNCNLVDNSFTKSDDWSTLVSLLHLNIDGNNVTFLPKCIQSLPKLVNLHAGHCSQIQSIQGLPKSVFELVIPTNMSLEKVHLPENPEIIVYSDGCQKLCEMEGCYKWKSVDKVDRKVLHHLGLGSSISFEGMELDVGHKQKVLYEFGIFSTCITHKQIPSCFTHKEKGPQMSFEVPYSKKSSFSMCLVFSQDNTCFRFVIEVYNKTKDLLWRYIPGKIEEEKSGCLSVWKCGNLLEGGDEIFVRIFDFIPREASKKVVECCINLIYEDEVGESCEDKHVVDQLAWSDNMFIEISDYVQNGKTFSFGKNRSLDYAAIFDGIILGRSMQQVVAKAAPAGRPIAWPYPKKLHL